MRVFADVGGQATLRLPRGAQLALFAAHDDGFAIEALDVPADRESAAFEVRVAAATWVSGRVVDADGAPVPQARVVACCSYHAHTHDWRGRFLDGVCATTLELSYRRYFTDADGRFRLPCADIGAKLSVNAWKWEDDGSSWERLSGPEPTVLTAEPIEGLRIVLVKKQPTGGR